MSVITMEIPITADPADIFAYSEWIATRAAMLKNPDPALNAKFINTHNNMVAAFVASANVGAAASMYVLSNLIIPNIPTTPASAAIAATVATLNCDSMPGAIGYVFQYKLPNSQTWVSVSTINPTAPLTGLTATTTYQWRVAGVFPSGNSAFSAVQTLTTTA